MLLLLVRLGRGALSDWDEAIYAQVSREILSGHHWLTLYWQHQPFFQKPPLSFWIRAELFRWFGVSEFWARFPSALAGVLTVLLTYAIARRVSGAAAGFMAAFVLLTTRQFDDVARQGTTDTLLCLSFYLAIYCYLRLTRDRSYWFYLLCAAIGLGVMIKGPAILVAPLAITLDWIIQRPKERSIRPRQYLLGGLLFLAIVAPWHIWMILQHGSAFLASYAGYQLAERATRVLEGSGGGPFYYARVIFQGAFPWSIFAVIAAFRWARQRQWAYSLPWILAGVTIVLYSLIPTKHSWYILPVYPALAIEVGRLLADAGKKWRLIRYATMAALAIGVMMAGARFLTRPGDALANQVAPLARLAHASSNSGPLLVLTVSGVDPDLDTPTAVFYSNRPATLMGVPADMDRISRLVQSQAPIDAILPQSVLPDLAHCCLVQSVARNGQVVYAVLSAKQ